MGRIKNLKKEVEYCLEKYPQARNSDIYLTLAIWTVYYKDRLVYDENNKPMVRLEDLYDLPREDNVKRVRATIQNDDKKYPPTSLAVAKKRKWKEQEWRDALGYVDNPSRG